MVVAKKQNKVLYILGGRIFEPQTQNHPNKPVAGRPQATQQAPQATEAPQAQAQAAPIPDAAKARPVKGRLNTLVRCSPSHKANNGYAKYLQKT